MLRQRPKSKETPTVQPRRTLVNRSPFPAVRVRDTNLGTYSARSIMIDIHQYSAAVPDGGDRRYNRSHHQQNRDSSIKAVGYRNDKLCDAAAHTACVWARH